MQYLFFIFLSVAPLSDPPVVHTNVQIVDQVLGKFQTAAQTWSGPLIKGATTIFWSLATISLVWSLGILVLKRADIGEILIELVRFVMTNGIFFWLLINGPQFSMAIIDSLRQLGGQATGTTDQMFPGDFISLSVMILQNQFNPINLFNPAAVLIPSLLALIVLLMSVLISAEMILLLVASWMFCSAGVVVLGLGSSRLTADISCNYFRTALSTGLRLMTMQLVIRVGSALIQSLLKQGVSNIGTLVTAAVAIIVLSVIAHKVPIMVAGMVQGTGFLSGVGEMSAMGAVSAASSGVARVVTLGTSSVDSSKHLADRVGVISYVRTPPDITSEYQNPEKAA